MKMTNKLNTGDKAPEFTLTDQFGGPVKLSDFKGRKLLVYFFPKADTPGCTVQSKSVSKSLGMLKEQGIAAVGISPDTPSKQKRFDEKYDLGFPLLADEDKSVAQSFGVFDDKMLFGKIFKGIIRSSFLIDEEGKIINAWYKVKPKDTVGNAMETAAD